MYLVSESIKTVMELYIYVLDNFCMPVLGFMRLLEARDSVALSIVPIYNEIRVEPFAIRLVV